MRAFEHLHGSSESVGVPSCSGAITFQRESSALAKNHQACLDIFFGYNKIMKTLKLWFLTYTLFMLVGVCTSNCRTVEEFEMYKAAAEQGDAKNQYFLAICYKHGEGVTKDEVEAVKWWRKSAKQGFAFSIYCLGVSYQNGEGVAKDVVEAYAIFNLDSGSSEERDKLAKRMSPAQIAAGKKRTIELKKSYKSIQ